MRLLYEKHEWLEKNGTYVEIYRPVIELHFQKKGATSQPSDGLLDSGADLIVLPLMVAKYFEVDHEKGDKISVQLADGRIGVLYKVPYKIHGISLIFDGVEIKETIAFSKQQDTALLGQDFFKYFKITFDRKNIKFELKKNKK